MSVRIIKDENKDTMCFLDGFMTSNHQPTFRDFHQGWWAAECELPGMEK
jgi:hypothetical protein